MIIAHSMASPVKAETIAAAISNKTIGSAICSKIFFQIDFLLDDSIIFGPYFSSLAEASDEVKPRLGSVPCFLTTSLILPL